MTRAVSRFGAPLLLAACVVVGGALRFYYAASLYRVYLPHLDVEKDEGYHEAAISLLAFHTVSYTVAYAKPWPFRGPLFPGFLSIVEAPFSTPWVGRVRMAEAALSTLAVPAVFALGQAAVSPLAGLLAAVLCALDPKQVEFVGTTNIGCFYSICLLAVALSATLWARRPSRKRLALLALATAASLMCRMAHFPLPILLASAVAFRRGRFDVRSAGLFATFLAAFLSPWLVRNAILFRRALPEDAEAGAFRFFSASIGERQCCDEPKQLAEAAALEPGLRPRLIGPSRYRTLAEIAVRNIAAHPLRYAKTVALNAADFFGPFTLPLLLGIFSLWKRPSWRQAMPLLVGASFLGNALIVIGDTHRDGLFPLCSAFAGAGLAALLKGRDRLSVRPIYAGWAVFSLMAVPAVSYAVTVGWLGAETWRFAGMPFASGDPNAPLEPRVMRLLDEAIPRSEGRYGLLERGQLYFRAGQYARACADFERAERRVDALGRCFALQELARCALLNHRVHEALQWTGQRIRDCEGASYEEIARDLDERTPRESRQDELEEAVAALDHFFRFDASQQAPARALRAALLIKLNRVSEGRAEFERAWRLDPTAACGPEAPDLDRRWIAPAYFDLCLAHRPYDAKLLHDRGVALFYRGRLAAAMGDLERAEKADPRLIEARLSRSTLLIEQGRLQEALQESRAAAALSKGMRPQEYEAALGLQSRILDKIKNLHEAGL